MDLVAVVNPKAQNGRVGRRWLEYERCITERFGQHKLVRLQFSGETAPDGLGQHGELVEVSGPVAELKVERTRVAEVLAAILDRHTVLDMSVQDPPLDQVIARVFEEAKAPASRPDLQRVPEGAAHVRD